MNITCLNLVKIALLSTLIGCANPTSTRTIPSEMTFVEVPSGTFLMGSDPNEEGRYTDEGPQHEVSIQYSFEMLSTEVSQSMWVEVVGSNPAAFVNLNNPVETVSYDDCKEFIETLNGLDSEYYYRLPTEAEWEYACRAGTETRYYSGDTEEDLKLIGWFNKNSSSTTAECAQLLPNEWGLYDMSGNVWEWCEDSYNDDYTGAPTDGSAWSDPAAPNIVSRGGSIGSSSRRCRSAARDACDPNFRYQFLGFRLVRTAR